MTFDYFLCFFDSFPLFLGPIDKKFFEKDSSLNWIFEMIIDLLKIWSREEGGEVVMEVFGKVEVPDGARKYGRVGFWE